MNPSLGMLSLPAELRVEIYTLIGPTNLSFTYTEYKGLYLSCKIVHYEMDAECSKSFQGEIHELRQRPSVFIQSRVKS
jgi:hypothetical protein